MTFILYCPVCGRDYRVDIRAQWTCPTDPKHEVITVTGPFR